MPSASPDSESMRVAVTAAPLRQQVVERIREAIAEGRFRPGDRLIERELCELLGVSRTSLREALRELESDGLISTLPNRGPVVTTISVKMAREIYEMRELFESLIAARFAQHAPPALRSKLGGAIDLLEAAYQSGVGVFQAKNTFYEVLIEGADHQMAATLLRSIQVRASQLRMTTLTDPQRAAASMREIRALQAAIKAGNAERARSAAQTHVRNAARVAIRMLEATQAAQ